MNLNINAINTLMVLGGTTMAVLGSKSLLLGRIGPFLAIGLGLADMTGIFTFDQIANQLKGIIPSSNYAGAYAVDLRQLPYDPNNYYLPPR